MRQIHYVIQTLLRGKGSIPFKVISLGLGLAMSILLFARVAYEQSYDTCFRDYDRIYQVWSQFVMNGEKLEPQTMNMGPLAGAILESFPKEVEMATCTNRYLASWPLYYGNHRFNESKICADSLFFQTMGIEVLSGNPVQDLQQPNVIYLSKSLAERMFGGEEPIGKVISYNHERDLTVRGTFADLPDNTTVGADAVISLPPTWAAQQMNYSWNGGDSYCQYVRLRPGVDVDDLNTRMEKMAEKYLPERDSWSYSAWVKPLRDTFRQQDDVRRMFTIMLTLGLSILFITALNYALISISSLSRRAKMVGVHKCSGASGEGIFGMFMLETLVVVALALGVMFLLLWGFRDFVEDTAATKLTNLFEGSRLWVPAATAGVLLLVGGRTARVPLCAHPCDASIPPLHGGQEGVETPPAVRAVCGRGLHLRPDVHGDDAVPLRHEQGHGLQHGAHRGYLSALQDGQGMRQRLQLLPQPALRERPLLGLRQSAGGV